MNPKTGPNQNYTCPKTEVNPPYNRTKPTLKLDQTKTTSLKPSPFILSSDVGSQNLKRRHIQVECLQTGSRVKVSISLLFSCVLQ